MSTDREVGSPGSEALRRSPFTGEGSEGTPTRQILTHRHEASSNHERAKSGMYSPNLIDSPVQSPVQSSYATFPSVGQPVMDSPPATGTLRTQLNKAFRKSHHDESTSFLPNDQLEFIINPDNVSKYCSTHAGPRLADQVTRILRYVFDPQGTDKSLARQVFAILVLMDEPDLIPVVVDENIRDSDLPLPQGLQEGTDYQLCRDTNMLMTPIECFTKWTPAQRSAFDTLQFKVKAPVFKPFDEHKATRLLDTRTGHKHPIFGADDYCSTILDNRDVLPFTSVANRIFAKNSEVVCVKIHHAHHTFGQQENLSFALKSFEYRNSNSSAHFALEVRALLKIKAKARPHLVELLTTFKHDTRYHLLFRWASDGDLSNLWSRPSSDDADHKHESVCWLAQQCYGLADGLDGIHNAKLSLSEIHDIVPLLDLSSKDHSQDQDCGRHGDIKPQNILWFQQDSNEYGRGSLKLSGFGLTTFHSELTTEISPEELDLTLTYASPEWDLREEVSRPFDIWSLGCVYLEFVTWQICGSDGIREFRDKRASETGIRKKFMLDNFYVILENNKNERYAEVKVSVIEWMVHLKQQPQCTAYMADFLDYIGKSMIVVQTGNRHRSSLVKRTLVDMFRRCQSDPEYASDSNGPLSQRTSHEQLAQPVSPEVKAQVIRTQSLQGDDADSLDLASEITDYSNAFSQGTSGAQLTYPTSYGSVEQAEIPSHASKPHDIDSATPLSPPPDDDLESIASIADTIGSKVDLAPGSLGQAGMKLLVMELTQSDERLSQLYTEAGNKLTLDRFVGNNRRLLKRFFMEISTEAERQSQSKKEALAFFRSRSSRTIISREIFLTFAPDTSVDREDYLLQASQQDDMMRRRVNDYLHMLDGSDNHHEDDLAVADLAVDDLADDDSDHPGSETSEIHNDYEEPAHDLELDIVKSVGLFLVESKAFQAYKERFDHFLHPSRRPETVAHSDANTHGPVTLETLAKSHPGDASRSHDRVGEKISQNLEGETTTRNPGRHTDRTLDFTDMNLRLVPYENETARSSLFGQFQLAVEAYFLSDIDWWPLPAAYRQLQPHEARLCWDYGGVELSIIVDNHDVQELNGYIRSRNPSTPVLPFQWPTPPTSGGNSAYQPQGQNKRLWATIVQTIKAAFTTGSPHSTTSTNNLSNSPKESYLCIAKSWTPITDTRMKAVPVGDMKSDYEFYTHARRVLAPVQGNWMQRRFLWKSYTKVEVSKFWFLRDGTDEVVLDIPSRESLDAAPQDLCSDYEFSRSPGMPLRVHMDMCERMILQGIRNGGNYTHSVQLLDSLPKLPDPPGLQRKHPGSGWGFHLKQGPFMMKIGIWIVIILALGVAFIPFWLAAVDKLDIQTALAPVSLLATLVGIGLALLALSNA